MILLLGAVLARSVAVLPLEGEAQEAFLATEGLRDAFLVEGWTVLSDGDLDARLGEPETLDAAREYLASGRRNLDAGRTEEALTEFRASLELHDAIGSQWLRRAELADVHYFTGVALLRVNEDPSPHLASAARLVEGYEPPMGYGLGLPVVEAGGPPGEEELAWLSDRLDVDAMVLGELRAGRLTAYWVEGEVRRRASRSVRAAPFAGDVLYREMVAELMGLTIAAEVEPGPMEYREVTRSWPSEPTVTTEPEPAAVPEEPGLVVSGTSRRIDNRLGWWAPVGLAVLGASAGAAWLINASAGQGGVSSPRYTVVIETPR